MLATSSPRCDRFIVELQRRNVLVQLNQQDDDGGRHREYASDDDFQGAVDAGEILANFDDVLFAGDV